MKTLNNSLKELEQKDSDSDRRFLRSAQVCTWRRSHIWLADNECGGQINWLPLAMFPPSG